MRFALMFAALTVMTGCVADSQVRMAIKKDPRIIFEAIEENPEEFMASVNQAARTAESKQREAQLQQIKAGQESELKHPRQPVLAKERRLLGSDEDKIIMVEYTDFQCPACRMAHEGLAEFKKKYKGKIQLYVKNMPLDFHPAAYPAALYFEAIRLQHPAKALKFYDYVFTNQKSMDGDGFLKKAAQQAGADMDRLAKDVKSEDVKRVVAWDMKEFSDFGFTGTPVLILNGVSLMGAQRLPELERVLQMTTK